MTLYELLEKIRECEQKSDDIVMVPIIERTLDEPIDKYSNLPKTTNKKLIIHETDCHGCGVYCYNNEVRGYSYDDDETGDLRLAIEALIDIGFLDKNSVKIYTDDDEIYKQIMAIEENKNE